MILQTLSDIVPFVLMFLLCIVMFANSNYVLNSAGSRGETGGLFDNLEQPLIWEPYFGNELLDSFY